MKISEIITDKYKLRIPPTVYYDLLADAQEAEEEQEPRKGHWIETAEDYYKAINKKGGGVNESTNYFTDDIACSECLAKFSVIDNEADRFDFCPCCGSNNR